MRRLLKTRRLSNFIDKNEDYMQESSFPDVLRAMCQEKGLSMAEVIRATQLDRTYGYQLFNGTRNPSRDKILMLAFGMGLDVTETQQLLRAGGKSALYPKLKRDAIIIHCLKNKLDLDSTQILLADYGVSLVGDVN